MWDQIRIRWLGRAVQVALKGDRRRRVETVGDNVECLLTGEPHSPANNGEL